LLPVSNTDAGPGRALSAKLVLGIFLPFSTGYYLSYLFRSINAVIAPDLVADAHLEAAELGFLTSVYFLTFALLQWLFGAVLGFWESPLTAGYPAEGYRTAFAVLASLQIVALCWFYGPGRRRAEYA
jgi:MFS family permease